MLEVKQINSKWTMVEGVYRVTINTANAWKSDEVIQGKILKFANTKKDLLSTNEIVANNTMAISFFTNCLIYGELITNKDIIEYTFEELLELIRIFGKNKILHSTSSAMAYFNLFVQASKYGYYSGIRNDYYVLSNFTEEVNMKDLVYNDSVFTLNQMKCIINEVYQEDVQISLLAALEGLKTNEVLQIRLDDLKGENHAINTGDRMVLLSDDLYALMKEYAKVDTSIVNGYNDTVYRKLADTPYLIRPIQTRRNNGGAMPNTTFSSAVKRELKKIGFEENTHCFRTNAMLYDMCMGMSVEDINKKYNTNFNHLCNVCKDSEKLETMRKLIREERNNKNRI